MGVRDTRYLMSLTPIYMTTHSPDYLVSLTPIYMTAHSPDHLVTIMEIVKVIRIVLCFLTKIIIVVGHIDYTGNYFES
jgi:hypothetical protein